MARERDEAKEALEVSRELCDGYRQEKAARIKAQNQAEQAMNQANNALGDWQDMKDKVERLEAAVAEGNPAKVASLQVEIDRLRSLTRANSRELGDCKAEEDRLKEELKKAEEWGRQEPARLQGLLTESLNRERLYLEQRDAHKEKAEQMEALADQRWLQIREFEDTRKGYSEVIKVWQNRALKAEKDKEQAIANNIYSENRIRELEGYAAPGVLIEQHDQDDVRIKPYWRPGTWRVNLNEGQAEPTKVE